MSTIDNKKILMNLLDNYGLSISEKDELLSIISHIFMHDEFQRRMTEEFYHHDKVTLGVHIIEDTIMTYLLSKKHRNDNNYDFKAALKIAMMHDLYMYPWQNNSNNKENHFCNKHGFRHPSEAIVNACTWFPEEFKERTQARKIIDGVLHHMFPLPVRRFDPTHEDIMGLKNFEMIEKIDKELVDLLIECGNRSPIGPYSFAQSEYKEGRIMSLSDKVVSMSNLKDSNINAYIALVTGKNKNLTLINHKNKKL